MSAYIFDTETTGLKHNELIEAAWLKIVNPSDLLISDEYSCRFYPSNEIEYGAMATHHITLDLLVNCEKSSTFKLQDDCEYIIGHNIDYDWNVIGRPDVKRICTLALARKYCKDIDSHKLTALLYYYLPEKAANMALGAHNALNDCKILVNVMRKMLPEYNSFEEMWLDSESARIPDVMPFGKHKGTPIAELPKDYVRWFLKQEGGDEYVRKAFEQVINGEKQ